jgi:hypothetical protein
MRDTAVVMLILLVAWMSAIECGVVIDAASISHAIVHTCVTVLRVRDRVPESG